MLRLTFVILLAAMVVGCTGELPTAAVHESAQEVDSFAKNGATKTVTIVEYDNSGFTFYLECLDEEMTGWGAVDFEITTIVTPTGRTKNTWKGLYSKPMGFVSESGVVWTLDKATQVAQEIISADGGYYDHFVLKEWYVSDSGEKLFTLGNYGVRLNEEGEIIFEKFHGWCPGQDDAEFSFFP